MPRAFTHDGAVIGLQRVTDEARCVIHAFNSLLIGAGATDKHHHMGEAVSVLEVGIPGFCHASEHLVFVICLLPDGSALLRLEDVYLVNSILLEVVQHVLTTL